MTQASIPYMLQHNIAAISVGVNPASAPPAVPSPNVWKFGNHSIITYWHKGGYPLRPGKSPQSPGGLSRKDCQFVDGLEHVLCFAFRSDNYGPPEDILEIKTYFNILRYEFPGARIKASTFEDFTSLLIPLKDTFPLVTEEIGDTWIQGPASDPIKMQRYRTINRLRSKCVQQGKCDVADKRFDDMSRLLLKLPEHTYGLSSDYDNKHWSNADFQPLQYNKQSFLNDTMSWLSHRAFNDLSIEALKDHPLAKEIKAELAKLSPYLPNLTDYRYHDLNEAIVCKNGMRLKVGRKGALIELMDVNGRNWADEEHQVGEILYRTFNTSDYARNQAEYVYEGGVFNKPGMEYTKAESRFWDVEARGAYVTKTGDPCNGGVYVRVVHSDEQTWFKYGAPTSYFIKYTPRSDRVDVEYQFFNKPSTRLPEALFLKFEPKPQVGHRWYVHKLGYLVDPYNVILNGSQYVHAVDQGVAYLTSDLKGLLVQSLDVATVAVQTMDHTPSPFPTPLTPMKTRPTAMAFNFYNNIWETNFVFWYPYQPQDKHYKARFSVIFK